MADEQTEAVLDRFRGELEHALKTHPKPGAIRDRVKRGETLYVFDVDDTWVVKRHERHHPPETARVLDHNVRWVLAVLADYEERGHVALKDCTADLDDEQKDSAIRTLLLIARGIADQVREAIRDEMAKQLDGLDDNGQGPTLH